MQCQIITSATKTLLFQSLNKKMENNTDPPDMMDVRKCLQGVGLYDPAMAKDDMINYYNFIKSSEDSAKEENEQRCRNSKVSRGSKVLDDDDEPACIDSSPELTATKTSVFQPKQWSKAKRQLEGNFGSPIADIPKKLKNHESPDLSKIDGCQSDSSCHKIKPIKHVTKYYGPYYVHESLNALSIIDKIQAISAYHLKLAGDLNVYQRKSIFPAERGKPIYANTKFNGCLDKSETSYDSSASPSLAPPEIYVSRSGRQLKRKTYREGLSDDEAENDKKKTKPEKPKSSKSAKKPINPKKMTNEEIMSRSSLFADSDSSDALKTRSEKLFDNLVNKEVKAKRQEKDVSSFKSLFKSDVDDDFEIETVSFRSLRPGPPLVTEPEEETLPDGSKFQKKRVVPPVVGRKGVRRNQAFEPINSPSTSTSNTNSNNSTKRDNSSVVVLDEKSSPPVKNSRKKQTKCPICSESFNQTDIEEHASTCGLTSELEIENNLPNQDQATMKCYICDTIIVLNTEYEVHVKECIEKQKQK